MLFTFLFISPNILTGQDSPSDSVSWEEMILNPDYNFYQVQEAFYREWEGKPYQSGNGYKQFKRWEYLYESTVNEDGIYDNLAIQKEYEDYIKNYNISKAEGEKMSSCASPNTGGNWTALGPFNVPNSNNGIGRVNVIGFDPTNANNLWVGSASGGLWKSTDTGASWSTSTDGFVNLGVGDIAIHPTDPDTMYLGTGDRDHSDTYSFGLLKSTDGGTTWATTSLPIGSFNLIHRVLINPNDPSILLVATSSDLYRSTDSGATWSVASTLYFRTMEFKPGDPNTVYAATYNNANFYRSTDAGATWAIISTPTPSSGTAVERFAIAVTPDNTSAVFLLGSLNHPTGGSDFNGLYKSTDSGLTFTEVAVTTAPSLGSQQWYDWSVAVSPTDEDEIFAGGVGFYKTSDGGVTWSSNGSGVHVDHHFAQYNPVSNDLYAGSDGGIYRTSNSGSSWSNLSDGLSITQYYRLGASTLTEDLVLTGAQDNGTHQLNGSTWARVFGGDGMECLISHADDNIQFASYQNGYVMKSTNGGSSFPTTAIDPGVTSESGAWVTPYVMDPTDEDVLWAGYKSIWKSTNGGTVWANSSGALTGGNMHRIAVAPSNTDVVYATDLSQIWKTTDGGSTWNATTDPGSSIRSITVKDTDPDAIWAAVGNSVFHSSDGGSNWSDVSGTLPNIPMRNIVYQPNTNDALYLGTEVGIYYTDASLGDWEPFSDDLPNVRIDELQIFELTGKIRAATFGRGLWESDLYCTSGFVCSVIENTYPYNEGFETSLGTWEQDVADDFDWTRQMGATPTPNTGPASASQGDYYMFAEATGNTGDTTNLISACLNISTLDNPTLFFDYHLYGANIGSLTVEVSSDFTSTWVPAWTLSGDQGNSWNSASIDLNTYATSASVLVRFQAVIVGDEGDIAIDSINIKEGCGTPISSYPYFESFETGLNDWRQNTDDNFDWTLQSGSTPSSGTGPSTANHGDNYLYTEASNNFNTTAILTSPCFDLTGLTSPGIRFDYNMYGSSMGTLEVEISADQGETWTSLWSLSGDQGNSWTTHTVDLTSYANQIVILRFQGTTGANFTSDMAIDKVLLLDVGNSVPICTNLSDPVHETNGVDPSAGFTWNAACADPTGYVLDVGTSSSGTDILNNQDVGNVTTYNPAGTFPINDTIFVTIKPYNSVGQAPGCTEEYFITNDGRPFCTNLTSPAHGADGVAITAGLA